MRLPAKPLTPWLLKAATWLASVLYPAKAGASTLGRPAGSAPDRLMAYPPA
ncbi:hypothetical protein D3C85_1494060 [compost metagenome]